MGLIDQSLNKKGQNLADLEQAWELRFQEGDSLVETGFGCGAISAYFYALEIRLKVAICDHLDLDFLPKAFEFHDLTGLLIVTGLQRELGRDGVMKGCWSRLMSLAAAYQHIRYQPQNETHLDDAKALREILTDTDTGVFSWLSKRRPHERSD